MRKKLLNIPEKRVKWLLLLGLIDYVFKIIFVIAMPDIDSVEVMDSAAYRSIAMNIVENNRFSEDGINPSINAAPFYPIFLAFIFKLFGFKPLIAKLVQCLLGVGISFLLYLIVKRFFVEIVAIVAFVISLFIPDLFVISSFLYSETLFIFLFLAAIFTALIAVEKKQLSAFVLAGLIGGIATLTRGVTMYFPFLIFLFLLSRSKTLDIIKFSAVYGIIFYLLIAPWTIRNYLTFDAFVPIAVGGGEVFWTGNYLPFEGKYNYQHTRTLIDSMTVNLNQIERDNYMMAEAKKNIIREPVKSGILVVKKFFRFWLWTYESVPAGEERKASLAVGLVLKITYYPSLILFFIGIFISRKKWKELMPIYLLIGYYAVLHTLTLVVPRYRIPILPLIIIFVSVALVDFYDNFVKNVYKEK